MKNAIYIDIDTERENPISFSKPASIAPPSNKEEAKTMILDDIACISEALSVLILMANHNEYGDKESLVATCIHSISSILSAPDKINEDESKG